MLSLRLGGLRKVTRTSGACLENPPSFPLCDRGQWEELWGEACDRGGLGISLTLSRDGLLRPQWVRPGLATPSLWSTSCIESPRSPSLRFMLPGGGAVPKVAVNFQEAVGSFRPAEQGAQKLRHELRSTMWCLIKSHMY